MPTVAKKRITMFRPMILSRHPSHSILRSKNKTLPLFPFRTLIRFGSSTENTDGRLEINTVESIKKSANKLLMKQAFVEANVKTAPWGRYTDFGAPVDIGLPFNRASTDRDNFNGITFPIVAKAHYGSKGSGNTLIKSREEFVSWMVGKNPANYIYEKFMNYGHEFRLHVTAEGCFYSCRKALKQDVPEDQKWRRHDDICVWFLPTNEAFHKPNSWSDIERDCVNALNAIGADILSFDVRVQTPTKDGVRRPYQDYILLECNSASSMDNGTGEISQCAKEYIKILPRVIHNKSKK